MYTSRVTASPYRIIKETHGEDIHFDGIKGQAIRHICGHDLLL